MQLLIDICGLSICSFEYFRTQKLQKKIIIDNGDLVSIFKTASV